MSWLSKRLVVFSAGVMLVGILIGGYAFGIGPFRGAGVTGAATDTTPTSTSTASPANGPVIATVDGSPIYLAEAKARLAGLTSVHSGGVHALGKDWHETLLQSLVDDQIIRAAAKGLGVTVSGQDMAEAESQVKRMFASQDQFQQWLTSQHMDVDELRRRIEMQLLATRVDAKVTADVTVSGRQIRNHYETHRDEFTAADGTIPSLLEVRESIRASLLTKAQARAYGAWLKQQRLRVSVVIVDNNWWRSLT